MKPPTYSNGHDGAVEAVEASPGDGAGVEGDQLAADGREGHLDVLQVLQQEQDTAVTHCGATQQSAQLLSQASLPSFPVGHTPSHFMLSGPFATRISCWRRHTSHCFPVSPLGHVHSPVRGSQEPPLHSHSAGLRNTESLCAFTALETGEGVVLFQLCSSNLHNCQLFSAFTNWTSSTALSQCSQLGPHTHLCSRPGQSPSSLGHTGGSVGR